MSFIDEIIKSIPNGLYYFSVGYVVWKIAQFYFVRFGDLEKRSGDIKNIDKRLARINFTVDRIARYIITKDFLDPAYFSSKSPITLNKLAKDVLKKSGGQSFVDSHLDVLTSGIEGGNPKSPFDVQQIAVSVVFNLMDSGDFSKIKDFIYQNPRYQSKQVNLSTMINIISLYLRDKYFEKHPEFKK